MTVPRLLILLAVALVAAAAPLRAQQQGDPDGGQGFLNPFPPGDVYQMAVIGDGLANGLVDGLAETFSGDVRVQLQRKAKQIWAVMRGEFESDIKTLEDGLQREPINIFVVMIGADDRVALKVASGKRVQVGSEEWRAEYSRRIDQMMKMLKRRNAAVYWVGLPNLRKSDANDDVQLMNEVIRERAFANGFKYVDAYAGFADEQGGYSAYGPDLSGKIRLLRQPDGIYFTWAGNQKLAHFVERELRRDLNTARNERTVPLLGSEAEQAKINPDKPKVAAPATATSGGSAWLPKAVNQPTQAAAKPADTAGEQKADNGRINLRTVGAGGREEVVTIDIVRPAIPASVVALVTRRESADRASQMGDTLVSEIAGGLSIMNSVTPSSDGPGGARRRLSPTQSPFFRVLVKGERLAAKPGRADDWTWPRPEPPAETAPKPANQQPPAAGPVPAPAAKSGKSGSKAARQ